MRSPAFRAHKAAYGRQVRSLRRTGQWQPFVDVGPVRERIEAFQRQGVSLERLAAASGIASSTIRRLLHRRVTRTLRHVAEAILSLNYVAPALQPVAGAQRRLQALCVDGWTQSELALRIGWNVKNLNRITLGRHRYVTAATHSSIATLYDDLLTETPAPGRGSTISAKRARAHGWVPREGWTTDTIDDPGAGPAEPREDDRPDEVIVRATVATCSRQPEPGEYRPRVRLAALGRDVDQAAVVAELARLGIPASVIASRLSARSKRVQELLKMAGVAA